MGIIKQKVTCLLRSSLSNPFEFFQDRIWFRDKSQVRVRFFHIHKLTFSKTGHNQHLLKAFQDYKKIPKSVVTDGIISETNFPFNLTLTQLKEGTRRTGAPRQKMRKAHALCHLSHLMLLNCAWISTNNIRTCFKFNLNVSTFFL